MNLKNSIFEKDKPNNNLNKVFIFKKNDLWVFKKDNKTYSIPPSQMIQLSLSPLMLGADKAIVGGCKIKKIDNPEQGFFVYFSTEEFIDCDIRLELREKILNGWVYNVFSEKLRVDEDQKIWSCDYLNLYFKTPPEKIYLKIEK